MLTRSGFTFYGVLLHLLILLCEVTRKACTEYWTTIVPFNNNNKGQSQGYSKQQTTSRFNPRDKSNIAPRIETTVDNVVLQSVLRRRCPRPRGSHC